MGKISLTKGRSVFVVDLILILVFVFVIYSGFKLHTVADMSSHHAWEYWAHFHIITAILSLIFGGLHIKGHWGWYKSLVKNGLRKKSRVTVILSALFLIEILTGIALILFIEGGNSPVGLWHYVLGIVMAVLVVVHLLKRFSILKKGLRVKKSSNFS